MSMKIFGRLVNVRITSLLVRLLWLLPFLAKEKGTSLAFCSYIRLQFAVYFVNQHSLEAVPCGYGALSTESSSKT